MCKSKTSPLLSYHFSEHTSDPFPTSTKLADMSTPDVQIVTSTGLRIHAHSVLLAEASCVLKSLLDQPMKKGAKRVVSVPGVPFHAVSAFVQFLYTSRCSDEEMENYGIHLLTLSHVFLVPKLKQKVAKGLAKTLNTDNVADVLELAKMCDAPDLSLVCMKLIALHFKTVEKTDGWKVLQDHDPWLELDVLQFMDEIALRRKMTIRLRREQSLYLQLSEAMECLEHICTEGCTTVGPLNVEPSKIPCSKFTTCQGLQMLIRHFASCKKRANGRCSRCKRMWQILNLHSSICDNSDHCSVPLCRYFKLKEDIKKGVSGNNMWQQLVRKVVLAKAISSLTAKSKTPKYIVRNDPMDVLPIKCHRLSR